MVTSLVKKIVPSEFGSLIQTKKNAYVSGTVMVIQPKLGQVMFDFKDVRADICVVRLRRDSGNGILMINSNGLGRGHQVSSKTSQCISFELGGNKQVLMHRTNRSRGDISILDISLYCEKNDAVDWNNQIDKCEDHRCLRLINNDLHASDGSYIKGNIVCIETEPKGMFIHKDNIVKFLGSCKIIDLEIGSKVVIPELDLNTSTDQIKEPIQDVKLGNKIINTSLIYDTDESGFSPVFASKDSVVNIGGIVLDRHSSYNIPLKNIIPGKKYNINIDVARIDGNGKFICNILPTATDSIVKIAVNGVRTFSFYVSPSSASNYSLSIWRHPSSKGRIRVSKVVVSGGIDEAPEPIKNRLIRHIPNRLIEPSKPVQLIKPVVFDYKNNHVTKDSIAFADYNIINNPGAVPVSVSTVSGMSWFSKIQGISDNIGIGDSANVSICSIDNLKSANKIFIDSFTELQVTDSVIEVLSKANIIFTPTEQGVSTLMNKLEGKDIRCLAKVWPYKEPVPVSYLQDKEFVVVVNRNPLVTSFVIDTVPNKRVVVIGARGSYPSNVIPINEYFPYNKLLWVLKKANVVFDFHQVEDHKSGLIDLCMNLGTPVVTSSWHYMNFSNVIFLDGSESVNDWKVPSKNRIAESFNDVNGIENIQAQKDSFESFIKEMI